VCALRFIVCMSIRVPVAIAFTPDERAPDTRRMSHVLRENLNS